MDTSHTCGDAGGQNAQGEPCGFPTPEGQLCHHHRDDPTPTGRPPYEPTPQDESFVESATIAGIPQPVIADTLGISEPTLRKHFRAVLDHGKAKANAQVAQTLFQMATSGKDTTASIFYAKTQMGWKETQRHEHAGDADAPIQIVFDTNTPDPDDA